MERTDVPTPGIVQSEPWHALPPEEVARVLHVDPDAGLSEREAEQRKDAFGENKLPERRRDTRLKAFVRQFKDPLIYILLIAAAASLLIGRFDDAAFIFAVLLFNAGLGSYQEYKARW